MNFNMHIVTGGGSSLARQMSVFSLTFDEFRRSLGGVGKDFVWMNMDELLKNIWITEESQAMEGAAAPGVGNAGLQRQGSFILPWTLSHMTVFEVWWNLLCPAHATAALLPLLCCSNNTGIRRLRR